LTRRRSAYRSITSLQRDNRVCRACVEAGYPLESLPVVQPYTGQRAYIHGQAPGALEGEQRLPWRGRAGRTLRRWLQMDEDEFYSTFYCASVTRCYPGKAPSGNGDRTPTPPEQELCAFWREWELRLIRPQLILAVGGLSARRLLGITGLADSIGHRFELDGAVAIPLPHPSGTSRWLNAPENRARLNQALTVVREELARLR
jgi:uracil-DNA glycosylase